MHMTSFRHEEKTYEGWIMSFVLPRRYHLINTPKPLTANIKMVEIPSRSIIGRMLFPIFGVMKFRLP